MDSAKIKARQYLEAYKTVEPFKTEYQMFLKGRRHKIQLNTSDNKHAAVREGTGVMERLICEMPETLHSMLYKQLTPEEWVWFDSVEGKKWFANDNREFSATGERL